MTTARPIIFSAPMVRALIDGRKTQTRRLVKFEVSDDCAGIEQRRVLFGDNCDEPDKWHQMFVCEGKRRTKNWRETIPYGAPGDLLWVRETWRLTQVGGGRGGNMLPFNAYEQTYRATEMERHYFEFAGDDDPFLKQASCSWRSPIHMPRWAARLTLAITDVRVERLHDISCADASDEGVEADRHASSCHDALCRGCNLEAVRAYWDLWDSINERPGARWAANPWVVALTFQVHRQNAGTFLAQRAEAP